MMNKKFDKIVIGIAIIVFAITPAVYSLDIRVLWAIILDLGEISIVAMASVFTGFLSVLIAGFSLWLSRQADKRNEKQARLSVRPILLLETARDGEDNTVEITLTNDGAGMAFIKEYVLYYKGEEVARDNANYKRFFQKDLEKLENYKTTKSGHLGSGSFIKVGEKKTLWSAKYNPKDKDMDGTILNRLDFYIEYQSIYGEEDETFIRDSRGREDSYEKLIS